MFCSCAVLKILNNTRTEHSNRVDGFSAKLQMFVVVILAIVSPVPEEERKCVKFCLCQQTISDCTRTVVI
jgi:hypothetical protein